MIKIQHKVLSTILCLVLAVSAICAGTAQAFAATGDTVYVKANNGWTTLYCYMWTGNSSNASWPGVKMTSEGNSVYSYKLDGNYENVIFNNGSSQTKDLSYAGHGKIYDLSAGTWSDYSQAATTQNVTAATSPEQPSGNYTVYLKNSAGWSNPSCYMWNGTSDANGSWLGVAMTKVSSDVYKYTAPKSFSNCIFSNNGGSQTKDLTAKIGYIYDNSTGSWSAYSGGDEPIETTPTTPITPGDGTVVYLKNDANWSNPTCYMWNDSTDSNAAWPGAKMTNIGDGFWIYQASKEYKNCIFNDGGASQTGDLTVQNGYYYNNSKGTWEGIYDTSPIQVKSYTADPASGIYTGVEVTLSAEAKSSDSASVYYKFSVTNPSGATSVISNFSSSASTTWIPNTTGKYVITFDFKDGAGNTNSRTLNLNVEDDSSLAKPVIKSVTPANLGFIKVNTATTVSVKAGGGKTGTNLLFYKYVVTDPNGVQNTPYYTLNSTYKFTPNTTGKYTVNVYVQGSDNSTVNKTYNYTVVSGDVPTTTAPITMPPETTVKPTTPVPTTTPATTVKPTTAPVTTSPIEPSVVLGDVDGDGVVTILDATYLQKYLAQFKDFSSVKLEAADVNKDGVVTIIDATLIQKMLAN